VVPLYGRRGVAKAASMKNWGSATRSLDCQLFVVLPMPQCDERSTEDRDEWMRVNAAHDARGESCRSLGVLCVHGGNDAAPVCHQCLDEAFERLDAVSTGSLVSSLNEALTSRGHLAIWRKADGTLHSETFKNYGRGEAECVLAALVRSVQDSHPADPLFVAQDPNFFWPLILYHGTVHAALEFVAPDLDWNARLGAVQPPLKRLPIVLGNTLEPGTVLSKCGNDICLNLQAGKESGGFKRCSQCERRRYCFPDCQKADRNLHKPECNAAYLGSELAVLTGRPNDCESAGHLLPICGEEVVLYGLMSMPELNGCVGVVLGEMADGRYPVQLVGRPNPLPSSRSISTASE